MPESARPGRTVPAAEIWIVDDDPVQRRLLEAQLVRLGHTARTAEGGAAFLEALDAGRADPAALVLDLMMPGMDGLGVLAALRERGRELPVVVQTAQGGIETVVRAMRAGAFDFVVKPVSPERLGTALANALKLVRAPRPPGGRRAAASGFTFDDMVGEGPAMATIRRIGERAARSTIPVLIEGESGTGKELVARAIRAASPRAARPFVAVNCGALPEALVESILFGHEKGAFTGAHERQVGKFAEADGGTLFLDEVGELPAELQVKLLRAIQEGEIDPIGARRPVKVDIRLISATNRDLAGAVREGRFREDLFYRLAVLPLTMPPLRERREDIVPLARHFLARLAREEGLATAPALSPALERMLAAHDWPGNVRELENAMFRAVVLAEGDRLGPADFPQIAAQVEGFGPAELGPPPAPPVPIEAPPLVPRLAPEGTPATQWGLVAMLDSGGALRSLAEIEAEAIRFAVELHAGRMSEVARRLGIGRSTLYRKLKELGIGTPEEGEDAAREARDG